MPRPNPGPFEPIVYFMQTPAFFRVAGVGGFAVFAIMSLSIAATHGLGYFLIGLTLLAVTWLDLGVAMCRRCRHYGTWHCAGQGMVAARLFARQSSRIGRVRASVHFCLMALFLSYGLFWLWHSILLGLIFTLWLPVAILSAIAPNGFSWLETGSPTSMA
jgi:hypothetical protein